jgi:hypothetical protein
MASMAGCRRIACEAVFGRDPVHSLHPKRGTMRPVPCFRTDVTPRQMSQRHILKEDGMKKIVLALAALGTLAASTTVFAQGIDVRIGGDRDRAVVRDRGFRDEGFRHREWRGADCRTTVIRDRRPDGSVVVRKIRRC